MLGVSRSEVKTRVQEALAMVDLEGFEDRYVDQISGGQQQRAAGARADPRRRCCCLMSR